MVLSLKKIIQDFRSSDLIRSNLVMFVGTMVVAVLNYAFYPILGRMMRVDQLGETQVIFSITTQAMLVVAVGKMIILNVLTNEPDAKVRNRFMREAEKAMLRLLLAMSLLIIVVSPFVRHFLQIGSLPAVLMLVPIVMFSGLRVTRDAYLRSRQLFRQSVTADALVSLIRILAAMLLVSLAFGTVGSVGGLVIGLLVAAVYAQNVGRRNGLKLSLARSFSPRELFAPVDTSLMRPHVKYAVVVTFVGVLLAMMIVLDSLAAKHYFSPKDAGLYAGISIVGNIVLFVTTSVGNVLVASVKTNIDHRFNVKKLAVSMAMLLVVGVTVTTVFAIAPRFVVNLMLGERYEVYAFLLPRVALTMLFLSIANLIFSYHIALRDLSVVYFAVFDILVMVASVMIGHESLLQMVNSILLASVILVSVNIARTLWWNVRKLRGYTG